MFLTTFQTPSFARAVSLFNGQAYIADHAAGLHVINYQAFDTGDTPPTGSMSTSVQGDVVTEGSRIIIQAEVEDDVQVRNVEFFATGDRLWPAPKKLIQVL